MHLYSRWNNEKNLQGIPICHSHKYVMCHMGKGEEMTEDTINYLLEGAVPSYDP